MEEPEPEPEPEPGATGPASRATVLVEVLNRNGRLVELCVGFRDGTVRGLSQPLSAEPAALGAFFVEAAYEAGRQGEGDTRREWPLNDRVDAAIRANPPTPLLAQRLAEWAGGGPAEPEVFGLASAAPRLAAAPATS